MIRRKTGVMLTFVVKKDWFEKIKNGEKIIYREIKPYWFYRIIKAIPEWRYSYKVENISVPCVFRLGYTKTYFNAVITAITYCNGKNTDLHIDKSVYAIRFELAN